MAPLDYAFAPLRCMAPFARAGQLVRRREPRLLSSTLMHSAHQTTNIHMISTSTIKPPAMSPLGPRSTRASPAVHPAMSTTAMSIQSLNWNDLGRTIVSHSRCGRGGTGPPIIPYRATADGQREGMEVMGGADGDRGVSAIGVVRIRARLHLARWPWIDQARIGKRRDTATAVWRQ
jgi:hypothetical protein